MGKATSGLPLIYAQLIQMIYVCMQHIKVPYDYCGVRGVYLEYRPEFKEDI